MDTKEKTLEEALKSMGFVYWDGLYIRMEKGDRAFVADIDEAEDQCVDGIRLYESYSDYCHRRVIGFEKYIHDGNDIARFIEYHGFAAVRNSQQKSEMIGDMQYRLLRMIHEFEKLDNQYGRLSRLAAESDPDIITRHLAEELGKDQSEPKDGRPF